MKKLILTLLFILTTSTCHASTWHDIQSEIGEDKFAHAGISYIICDQLHRNAGMNKFWSSITTIAIGAAKENWIDNRWDGGDFTADCIGVMLYHIEF